MELAAIRRGTGRSGISLAAEGLYRRSLLHSDSTHHHIWAERASVQYVAGRDADRGHAADGMIGHSERAFAAAAHSNPDEPSRGLRADAQHRAPGAREDVSAGIRFEHYGANPHSSRILILSCSTSLSISADNATSPRAARKTSGVQPPQ